MDNRIDEIFDRIDGLLLGGRFDEVDNELRNLDLTQETALLLSYLSISFAAKFHLQQWAPTVNKIRIELEKRRGRQETRELLRGFDD